MDKQEFNHLIMRLKSDRMSMRSNEMIQLNNLNGKDFQKILELLCHTYDMEMKLKIFTFLGTYLLSKVTHRKTIVMYRPLYDEIQNMLSKGLTLNNTRILYFALALLTPDLPTELEGASLVMFAQNLLRLSGCLATMAEIFIRGMMYQDSWIALCRCVAEACRGNPLNQNYCSFLVPECVRKCVQENMESCLVLQSLLHNCDRNIQVFLDCNGPMIFTRKTLHYDMYLQLLETIVQRSSQAAATFRKTEALSELKDSLDLFGPDSKIGQWSTIILYHINKWSKRDTIEHNKNGTQEFDESEERYNELNEQLNFTEAIAASKTKDSKLQKADITAIEDNQQNCDDTRELLQNIFQEMAYWNSQQAGSKNSIKKDREVINFPNTNRQRKDCDDTDISLKTVVREITNEKLLGPLKMPITRKQSRNPETLNDTDIIKNFVREIVNEKLLESKKQHMVNNQSRNPETANDTVILKNFVRESANENLLESTKKTMAKNQSSNLEMTNETDIIKTIVREVVNEKLMESEKKTMAMNKSKNFETVNNTEILNNFAREITNEKLMESKKEPVAKNQSRNLIQTQKVELVQDRRRRNTFTIPSDISVRDDNTSIEVLACRETQETDFNDLSFSFIYNQKQDVNEYVQTKGIDESCFVAKPTLTTRQFSKQFRNNAKIVENNSPKEEDSISRHHSTKDDRSSKIYSRQFKPPFASTPKRKPGVVNCTTTSHPSTRSLNTHTSSRVSLSRSTASLAFNRNRRPLHKLQRTKEEKQKNKSVVSAINKKQSSMSARLFTAINESCTTFVKSVKGIFRYSSHNPENKQDTLNGSNNKENMSCSFSFTDYMRKRDEMVAERTGYNLSMDMKKTSCKTCDETTLLRHKLANDDYLRETVKKLKYGINLYGCDFKKISRVMWPADRYMTHQVLYKLYRKLLAK